MTAAPMITATTTTATMAPWVSQRPEMGRSMTLAAAFHLAVAAVLLTWPQAASTLDEPPVVEMVMLPAPPEKAAEEPPPVPPQQAAKRESTKPVAAPARVAAKPVAAPSPAAPIAEDEPIAEAVAPAPAPAPVPEPVAVAAAAAPDLQPTPLDMPRPTYPRLARQRGWEGVVMLTVAVDALGCPTTVTVKSSSGHPVLDQAAVEAARKWHFRPARRDGQDVAAAVELPIRFTLGEA